MIPSLPTIVYADFAVIDWSPLSVKLTMIGAVRLVTALSWGTFTLGSSRWTRRPVVKTSKLCKTIIELENFLTEAWLSS